MVFSCLPSTNVVVVAAVSCRTKCVQHNKSHNQMIIARTICSSHCTYERMRTIMWTCMRVRKKKTVIFSMNIHVCVRVYLLFVIDVFFLGCAQLIAFICFLEDKHMRRNDDVNEQIVIAHIHLLICVKIFFHVLQRHFIQSHRTTTVAQTLAIINSQQCDFEQQQQHISCNENYV